MIEGTATAAQFSSRGTGVEGLLCQLFEMFDLRIAGGHTGEMTEWMGKTIGFGVLLTYCGEVYLQEGRILFHEYGNCTGPLIEFATG